MAGTLIISIYLRVILCGASTIGIGYLVYGSIIFERGFTAYQMVPMGLAGGLFAATIERLSMRYFLIVALLVLAALVLLTNSRSPALIFRDYVYLYGIASAIKTGLASNRFLSRMPFGKFLAWGPIFASVHSMMFLLLAGALRQMPRMDQFVYNAGVGLFLGLGIGLGEEVSARIVREKECDEDRL